MTRLLSEADAVAAVDGLSVGTLRVFVASNCVVPREHEGRLLFDEVDLARLRLLSELATDFDLDTEASALVLSLIDQIHGLRRELRRLAEAVADQPEEVRVRICAASLDRQGGAR